MKKIGYVLLLGSAFCLLGTVGAMEHSGMPLAEGMTRSAICLAILLAGVKIIKKMEELLMEKTVKTNIGEMPIEDYRDIKARQFGFEDYDDMYEQGYRLGDGYDYETK